MTRRILVIDDEQAVRDSFEFALTRIGYEVETAADGEAGVRCATARKPDLVFLDLRMPGINGVETLRRLTACCAAVPVCIVTAFRRDFVAQLDQAAHEGLPFSIADKPLTVEQIRAAARALLEGGVSWDAPT